MICRPRIEGSFATSYGRFMSFLKAENVLAREQVNI